MPFTKGSKLCGRPKGSKNKEDLNSLRKILEENFSENRLLIKSMIKTILTGYEKQLNHINDRLLVEQDITEISTLARAKSNVLEDFKWLLHLKASLEPKDIKVDMEPQTNQIILIRSEKPYMPPKVIDVDNRISEHTQVQA